MDNGSALPNSSSQILSSFIPKYKNSDKMDKLIKAERQGFEPWVEEYPYNGLAIRRLQPLSHLSGSIKF